DVPHDALDWAARSRRPADQRGWYPPCLASRYAGRGILAAVIVRLGYCGEQRPIAQCVNIDDAPHAGTIDQRHCHIHTAAPADDLLVSPEAKAVSLQLPQVCRGQGDVRPRVGECPRIMLAAEGALAGAKDLLARQPVRRQLDPDRATVALA